jgi:uncharacterized membrane protein YfhO
MNFTPARGLWTGDQPQARLLDAAGELRDVRRTTSRIFAEVHLDHPTRVLFNQNFAPGWSANTGEVVSLAGMLAVDLSAGTHRLQLVYRPRTLVPGIALTLLGCVLALGLVRFGRFDRAAAARANPAAPTPPS